MKKTNTELSVNTVMNTLVLRLKCLQDLLEQSKKIRQDLIDELIDNATDDVIVKRRIRMLNDLCIYESMVIAKIARFESDDASDWLSTDDLMIGLFEVTNRSS